MAGLAAVHAQPATAIGIAGPALSLINTRTAQNQSQFYVYEDVDSGFNHGFPSGVFGVTTKVHTDPACVYSSTAMNGCSTDPTVLDRTRGTVFRVTFDPLATGEFAGLNFEEPQNWGTLQTGAGYDLTGATQLAFDAVSLSSNLKVQFGVAGATTAFMPISQTWTPMTIDLATLGLTAGQLSGVHILFSVASNDVNASAGGTILLDNIRFQPVPAAQTTRLGLPIANQVFGILHAASALAGPIPVAPDQLNANLATAYESSLALIAALKRGQAQDLASARLIADTLVYAVGHDNQGDRIPAAPDGSSGLHNGMSNGDIALYNDQASGGARAGQVRLAGFTAAGQCPATGFCLLLDGASGGNNAFAVLALVAAYNQFQDVRYLNAAVTIGNWIYGNLADSSGTGYGGYFIGYPDQGTQKILQTGKSVENNADIFQAFSALAAAENALGNSATATEWTRRANIAGDFVIQMFDPASGHFFAGTVPPTQSAASGIVPAGAAKGNDVINTFDFLDAQTFTTIPLAAAPRYRNQIDWRRPIAWLVNHFARSISASGQSYQGFDLIEPSEHGVNDGPAGIAWEFTAQAVVAMRLVDSLYAQSQFTSLANFYLGQILQAQTMAPLGDGMGVPAATLQDGATVPPYQQCLVTPFQCIAERVGLAATAWAVFADQNVNPFGFTSPVLESPANGAMGVALNAALTWSVAGGATSYDVYFGTTPVPPFAANTVVTSFSPGALTANTTYYWRVVTKSGSGSASSDTWSFTTFATGCGYTLGSVTADFGGAGGTGSVTVSTSPGTCEWTAASSAAWVGITSGAGTGAGTVSFTVSANASAAPRSATLLVAGLTFTVNQGGSVGSRFVPITPCRVADTRNASGPFGGPGLAAQTSRDFAIPNSACHIPATATAYSLEVAVVPANGLGFITVWPAGQTQPLVATLTSVDGRIRTNAAIVPAGYNGAISVYATDATDIVFDINGYFISASDPSGLSFYPIPPCRVADTRNSAGSLGGPSLAAQSTRTFPIAQSSCGLPSNAQAYSLNFAAVPKAKLGYLTAFPTGQAQPLAASLTAVTGTITANAVIVPAGTNASVDVYSTDDTDLVIDANGYFAAPGSGGLALYNLSPCRALDTRGPAGPQPFTGSRDLNVAASGCGAPASAQAYVFNASVVPPGLFGYLTLWPQGQTQPLVATLNAIDGAITSNLAIVPAQNGSISAFAFNPTDLVMDLFGYFAP